jgi:hypothetical protein
VFEAALDSLPELQLEPFSYSDLGRWNWIDTSVIAHRGRPELMSWNEELAFACDWELVSRITSDQRPPLVLPVRAVHYYTSSPNRRSTSDEAQLAYAEMRRRVRGN